MEQCKTIKSHLEMVYIVGSAVVLGVLEGVAIELGIKR